jgi:hypothetical protein
MQRNQQNRDRVGYQQQGLGQRGSFDQNYGGYDRGRYGGDRERGYDRGGPNGYEQRARGGSDRPEQRGGYCEHCGRGDDRPESGRFGGSRQDAYDHERHPRSMRGNTGDRYEQDRGYDQSYYGNRGGYEPYPMNRDHGNMQRTGWGQGGYEEADDDRRYHGSSQRGYDADWYGRDTMSPWSRR